MNWWQYHAWFGVTSTTSRPQALATTVPTPNANMMDPDLPSSPPNYYPDVWMNQSASANFGQFGFRSLHPGGVNFLFGDGSVRFIKESIQRQGVYFALGTRKGGEVISADQY